MMTSGSWQVRVTAEGPKGKGRFFRARAGALLQHHEHERANRHLCLAALGLVLVVGAVSIVGAGVREGQLEPGACPIRRACAAARWVMAATAIFVLAMVALGGLWWKQRSRRL